MCENKLNKKKIRIYTFVCDISSQNTEMNMNMNSAAEQHSLPILAAAAATNVESHHSKIIDHNLCAFCRKNTS